MNDEIQEEAWEDRLEDYKQGYRHGLITATVALLTFVFFTKVLLGLW